ncbi:MAG: hypothetical protein AB8B99_05495 [Phormidesmis sp.]
MSIFTSKMTGNYGKYFLLGLDLALILVSISRFGSDISGGDDVFSISKDRGYAEYFQYAKFGVAIVLLSLMSLTRKSALMGGWAFIFCMLVFDDRVSIHERLGTRLSEIFAFEPMWLLRAEDYGELVVYATMAVIAGTVLIVTSLIESSPEAHQLSRALFVSLLGLAFFGGVVDMLSIAASQIWTLSEFAKRCLDAVEDGGEMIVISIAIWQVYQAYAQTRMRYTLI